jgi:V/A-type H+-transporting ATPase subunit D
MIKPTRMELLLLRRKLKLAEKGHKLLKEKRDVLIMEFFKVLKDIQELRKGVGERLSKAQKSLLYAQAADGQLSIERLDFSGAEITFSGKNIMGVEFPQVKDVKAGTGWPGYISSVELDSAIKQYRDLFPNLIRLSEKQLMLSHLAEEIKKTKRRVNSLEYIIIPNMEEVKKMITFKLEELERENFSRLKIIKKRTAR